MILVRGVGWWEVAYGQAIRGSTAPGRFLPARLGQRPTEKFDALPTRFSRRIGT